MNSRQIRRDRGQRLHHGAPVLRKVVSDEPIRSPGNNRDGPASILSDDNPFLYQAIQFIGTLSPEPDSVGNCVAIMR
ncbi:MAG: hypothetical protein ACJAU6_002770 [Alphaproteobacteria bacterium]|jgi:hypothetical protein